MVSSDSSLGIVYPDRAEGVAKYADYKVFVDFWQPLTDRLAEQFRVLRLRGQTKILAIYGEQGSGKTLFSTQLLEDHESTKRELTPTSSAENLWLRIAAGAGSTPEAIKEATQGTVARTVPDSVDWVTMIKQWRGVGSDISIVAIADNSETDYFLRGLVGDRFPNATKTNDAYLEAAAGNLVKQARFEDSHDAQGLTGMLLIMLSNDRIFLDALKRKVDGQHKGMMEVIDLPLPTAEQKERAVRVNVNRLNDVSYWYCLDKGGDEQRKIVRTRLVDATTFPDTFGAVDRALISGKGRVGRPGRKNLLTLVCFSPATEIDPARYALTSDYNVEAHHKWAASYRFDSDWANKCGLVAREAGLLESEWNLRIVALGQPFVAALLAADPMDTNADSWSANAHGLTSAMLKVIQEPLGTTSSTKSREQYSLDIEALVDRWIEDISPAESMLGDFWGRGQGRARIYERKLSSILGSYNRTTPGYLSARPDYVVEDFVAAALTSTQGDSSRALTDAIQRKANAMEFTSQATVTPTSVGGYLATKLPNYVQTTQEQ